MVAEPRPDGVLIRPAVAVPVEVYTPERKAEFLLSTAVDPKAYAWAVELDANVLFSAAYGSPRHQTSLQRLLDGLTVVQAPAPDLPCPIELPAGDREAFLAPWLPGPRTSSPAMCGTSAATSAGGWQAC